jgi:hypothetical protein
MPESGRLSRAIALLESELAAGPQPARSMLDRADGIPQHILAQAKHRAGVKSHRVAGRWEWRLNGRSLR